MKNNIKKFENFEHDNDEDLDYTLLREIEGSDEYNKFRQHYTAEIRSFLTDNNGRFTMTHQITQNIITDVVEMVKKLGYDIIKK
jgi:hypothetical protein